MYKFFFLINPVSGGGQGKVIHKFLPEIMESMDFKPDEWKSEFTRKDGLNEQVLKALSSTETLVAVGGDGTVSSVLSIMLTSEDADRVQIGLIPLGTGNDLARVLGLYKPFADKGLLYLVRRLLMAKARPFDIWTVNGKSPSPVRTIRKEGAFIFDVSMTSLSFKRFFAPSFIRSSPPSFISISP